MNLVWVETVVVVKKDDEVAVVAEGEEKEESCVDGYGTAEEEVPDGSLWAVMVEGPKAGMGMSYNLDESGHAHGGM